MSGSALLSCMDSWPQETSAAPAWPGACDKEPAATNSTCSPSKVAVAAPETPAPSTPGVASTARMPSRPTPGCAPSSIPRPATIGGPGALPPLTEEEAKLLLPEIQEEPVETVLRDGSVMVDLKGHGQEYFILQVGRERTARGPLPPGSEDRAADRPTSQPQDR